MIITMVNEETCKRCGMCCHYEHKGKLYKCKYLVFAGNKSSCRIYRNRLGTTIAIRDGIKYSCVPRSQSLRTFDGCPYNHFAPPIKEVIE